MKVKKEVSIRLRDFLKNGISVKNNTLHNKSVRKKKIVLKHFITIEDGYFMVDFRGKVIEGSQKVEVRLISLDRKWVSESAIINQTTLIKIRKTPKSKHFLLYINIPSNTKVEVEKLAVSKSDKYSVIKEDDYKNDILVITPMFPSDSNPYSATFVYSKIKEYLNNGLKVDISVVNTNEKKLYRYDYKGITVNKHSFDDLRNVVQRGKYKKILIHFFDREICNALLACDLDNKDILIYCHGADVDLWNPDINTGYFVADKVFTDSENKKRIDRLNAIATFEKMENVKWIFNTEWNYLNTKNKTGLEFRNHAIIPCFIDEDGFPYEKRTKDKRTNILILKKMDNVRQYAVDLAVRVVLKLSKEPFFNELNITFVGAGEYQDKLTEPVKKFSNVKIVNSFYDHDAIKDLFSENGILLAPSRYDTQGVTVGEAAMSGMVVVASKGTGVSDMLPEECGTFFDNKKIEEAVTIIKDIYNGKKDIEKLSELFHNAIIKTASKEKIKEEIELIKTEPKKNNQLTKDFKNAAKKKETLLSIIIPAYNSEQYIEKTIKSIVCQKNVGLMEVIVVNDGSSDSTSKIVKRIIKESSPSIKKSIVLIDKENGGHGSTINVGLKKAKGKYVRIVDADDRLDTLALEKHLDFLKKVDTDIVFTDTIHDLSIKSVFRPDHKYDFMEAGVVYDFDELCDKYYGFKGYGPVLSTSEVKTEKLREVGCTLPEKSFYVDIIYNYYMTLASRTAIHDTVDLYYYYLGRDGQSLSDDSYKRNFNQHLRVLKTLIQLLNENKLTDAQNEHFVRIQLHETVFHQYRIALEMFNDYKKFQEVEKELKQFPNVYNDSYLTPGYVKRMRRFGYIYYLIRKAKKKIRPALGSIKRIVIG